MNFDCIIDSILHHNLCTTLRDDFVTILVNVLEINCFYYSYGNLMVYMILCFINYSYTINNYSQFETTYK